MNGCALPVIILAFGLAGCATRAHPTIAGDPDPDLMAELWQEPRDIADRDLLNGRWGTGAAPDPREEYLLLEREERGTHLGYDVSDERGRSWSVKLGPEAQVEVVVSRLAWAAGYHQPPVYFLPHWTLLSKRGKRTPQGAARFRLKLPDRKKIDSWAWHENPFVGTRPLRGLFVLMVMVNNWDLKSSQNALYRISGNEAGPSQWYVVRDLGASLGRTQWFFPGTKNNLTDFEDEGFIKSIEGDKVKFHYRGAWREPHLKDSVTTGDVRWICERLSKLTDRQWGDAFRAGGYAEPQAQRYIKRLKQKVADGLRLSGDRS